MPTANNQNSAGETLPARKNHFQKCKFCGDQVNLDDEGTQYCDGTAAHEGCDDGDQFSRANASDFRD